MYDDLVIGAGMAGLTTAALLAREGRRVLVLEAHDTPGGYAHTFQMGQYRFCAQVHYILNCGEGEPVYELLRQLGLHEEVRFHRLDPEGFDHVVVAGKRYRIPNGLEKFRDRVQIGSPTRNADTAMSPFGVAMRVAPGRQIGQPNFLRLSAFSGLSQLNPGGGSPARATGGPQF